MTPVPAIHEPVQMPVPRLLQVMAAVEVPAGFTPVRLRLLPGGMALDLSRPHFTFGRHSQCDLRLPTPEVSRRHGRLFFSAGEWVLEDCNSLNGSYVNDKRVVRCTLRFGDQIRIGDYTFEVQRAGVSLGEHILRTIADVLPAAIVEAPIRQAS